MQKLDRINLYSQIGAAAKELKIRTNFQTNVKIVARVERLVRDISSQVYPLRERGIREESETVERTIGIVKPQESRLSIGGLCLLAWNADARSTQHSEGDERVPIPLSIDLGRVSDLDVTRGDVLIDKFPLVSVEHGTNILRRPIDPRLERGRRIVSRAQIIVPLNRE